jgi:hypothetical protein
MNGSYNESVDTAINQNNKESSIMLHYVVSVVSYHMTVTVNDSTSKQSLLVGSA